MPEYGSGGGYTVVMAGPFASSGGGTGKLTTISAPVANWKGGTSPYSQVVSMDDISISSKIDIQLSADQIELFSGQDIAFTVENRGGEVTLVAVGDKPSADCVFQAIASEVLIVGDSDGSVIRGNTVKTTSFTKTGGVMSNPINMNNRRLFGLKEPTSDDEPVNFGRYKKTEKIYRNGTVTGDLNDAITPGWYWVKVADCTNTPFDGGNLTGRYGHLEVITSGYPDSVSNVFQRFTQYATGNTWVRTSVNGWNDWIRVDSVNANPVGSIYMSVNKTSPASLYGGSWEQLKDRFLLGDGSTYTAGATGGAATHTLTVDQIPSHNHTISAQVADSGGFGLTQAASYADRVLVKDGGTVTTSSNGGGKSHNNMPPYLVVYMWKRIA